MVNSALATIQSDRSVLVGRRAGCKPKQEEEKTRIIYNLNKEQPLLKYFMRRCQGNNRKTVIASLREVPRLSLQTEISKCDDPHHKGDQACTAMLFCLAKLPQNHHPIPMMTHRWLPGSPFCVDVGHRSGGIAGNVGFHLSVHRSILKQSISTLELGQSTKLPEFNEHLSQQRAEAVRQHLVANRTLH